MNATGIPDPALHATPPVLSRARSFAGRVTVLGRADSYARTTMHGTLRYEQTLRWSPDGALDFGRCTCPHARGGSFCKHLVAALQHLASSPAVTPEVLGRGVGTGGDATDASSRLAGQVRASFAPGRHPVPAGLGGRDRLEVEGHEDRPGRLRVFSALLDRIESDRAAGSESEIVPSAQRTAVRTRAWWHSGPETSDEEQCLVHRAIAVAARVMRDAGTTGPEIAAWVLSTQLAGGGAPYEHLRLPEALGDDGLAAYRWLAAEHGDPEREPSDDEPAGCAFETRDVLASIGCELAIHDGDARRAIALASVIDDDVDTRTRLLVDAAARLDASGNATAVTEHLWELIEQDPGPDVAAVLHDRLARGGAWSTERTRFWVLLEAPGRTWPVLETALRIGDAETAWAIADEHGAGAHWTELVSLQPPPDPRRCASLFEAAARAELASHGAGSTADGTVAVLRAYRHHLDVAEALRDDSPLREQLEERYEAFVDELLSTVPAQDGLAARLVEAGML